MKIIFIVSIYLLISHVSPRSLVAMENISKDLLLKVSGYLTPQEALQLSKVSRRFHSLKNELKKVQLPNLYKEMNGNIQDSFFTFNLLPTWKLEEKIPTEMKTLIHDWYLRGLKEKSLYKKFCYMMAAGRAGHYQASLMAGEMLIKSPPKDLQGKNLLNFIHILENNAKSWNIRKKDNPLYLPWIYSHFKHTFNTENENTIPLILTLDDIARVIPEYSNPQVRNWDILKLNEEHIQNNELKKIEDDLSKSLLDLARESHPHIIYSPSIESSIQTIEMVKSKLKIMYQHSIKKIKSCSSASESEQKIYELIFKKSEFEIELDILSGIFSALNNFNDLYPQLTLENLHLYLKIPHEQNKIRALLSIRDKLIDYITQRVENFESFQLPISDLHFLKSIDHPTAKIFLINYYSGKKKYDQAYEEIEKYMQSKINKDVCLLFIESLHVQDNFCNSQNDQEFFERATKIKEVCLVAGLLSNTQNNSDANCVFLTQTLNLYQNIFQDNTIESLLLKNTTSKYKNKVCAFVDKWYALNAFQLQLQLLRNPNPSKELFSILVAFYRQKARDGLNPHSVNIERSQKFAEYYEK